MFRIGNTSTQIWWIFQPVMLVFGGIYHLEFLFHHRGKDLNETIVIHVASHDVSHHVPKKGFRYKKTQYTGLINMFIKSSKDQGANMLCLNLKSSQIFLNIYLGNLL